MSDPSYWIASEPGPFRQCELLSNVRAIRPLVAAIDASAEDEIEVVTYPWALIMSQDCDLEWDSHARSALDDAGSAPSHGEARKAWNELVVRERSRLLEEVLMCVASDEGVVRESSGINRDRWTFARSNQHERFHFLRDCGPADDAAKNGFGVLVVDFKRYFATPAGFVASQEAADHTAGFGFQRRAVLQSPFLEDVASRFYNYQARVALPDFGRADAGV